MLCCSTESDELLDESTTLDNIVYNLMYDNVLNLNWVPSAMDIDWAYLRFIFFGYNSMPYNLYKNVNASY